MKRIVHLHIASGADHLIPRAGMRPAGAGVSDFVMSEFYHQPVLMKEVLDVLAPAPGELFVDCTLGGGGHTLALLQSGARVLAFDQDAEALRNVPKWAPPMPKPGILTTAMANFRHLEAKLDEFEVEQVDGILADLGISSRHVDNPERGFSFQHDGPLDMRMSHNTPVSAADICNEADAEELTEIFRTFGEEPRAKSVAQKIVDRRASKPFTTTSDLAAVVASVIPRRSGKHPATKIFQALRIAVNDELGALAALLESLPRILKPGGRVAIISFHSLEDRMVKQYLRRTCTSHLDRPEWPEPRPNPDYFFKAVQRRGITPSPEEVAANPRSRSAILRAAIRI